MAGVGVGPAAVAVCYHRSVRGREKQDGRMEVDGPGSWKTQTCPCKRDNEGTTVKSPSSETSGTKVCSLGQDVHHSNSVSSADK